MKQPSQRDPKVAVIQDGARRHYIVPYALQRVGLLESVFADWYVRRGTLASAVAKCVGKFDRRLGQKMLDRRRDGLDDSRVRTNLMLALRIRLNRRKFAVVEDFYQWTAHRHANWILRKGFGSANMIYGFIRNVHPNVWRVGKLRGLKTIGDQIIAPAAIERDEYLAQQQRWPGWEEHTPLETLADVEAMEEESWAHCDHIVCGSDYVKDGLVRCGVAPEKVSVIPYAPSGSDLPFIERHLASNPIIVGFVGTVCLRKGVPYFFEVAKRFSPDRVKFVMVGPVLLKQAVADREKGNVDLVGGVPRSHVKDWLARFHIFFFPSTCEGCAGSVLEAMDTGLPIVSTPNSGTIVRDGIEGYITDYDDVERMVESIERLVSDAELRLKMGLASRRRIESFDTEWYSQTLKTLMQKQLTENSPSTRQFSR